MQFSLALSPSPPAPPLYEQLYRQLREGILAGRWAPGELAPSTRELAQFLGVARGTVTRVYDDLVSEGYLESRAGARTRVSSQLPEALLPRPVPAAAAAARIRLSYWGKAVADMPATVGTGASPDLSAFPQRAWSRRVGRMLRAGSPAGLDYRMDVAGDASLRRELAGWLRRTRGVVCTPEHVLITNGTQQGLDLVLRLLLERGQPAAMEEPGYTSARMALRAAGARIFPVEVDEEGLVPARLPRRARVLYLTPSHQFPTGALLSLPRRLEILAWARRTRAVILEDDYDSELRYASRPVPALQGLSQDVPVVYMGTFSKILFPALRVGYLVAPAALMAALIRAKRVTDRETRSLEQAALAEFIGDGSLERHVRRMRTLYGRRHAALVEACRRTGLLQLSGDAAGMHALVHLRPRLPEMKVLQCAAASGLPLSPAGLYYHRNPPRNHYLLAFAHLEEARLTQAVLAFAAAASC